MRLAIRLLGLDLLTVEVSTDEADEQAGECTTYPVGFAPSPGDQRWERGVDL